MDSPNHSCEPNLCSIYFLWNIEDCNICLNLNGKVLIVFTIVFTISKCTLKVMCIINQTWTLLSCIRIFILTRDHILTHTYKLVFSQCSVSTTSLLQSIDPSYATDPHPNFSRSFAKSKLLVNSSPPYIMMRVRQTLYRNSQYVNYTCYYSLCFLTRLKNLPCKNRKWKDKQNLLRNT